jgi:hypothetical protein
MDAGKADTGQAGIALPRLLLDGHLDRPGIAFKGKAACDPSALQWEAQAGAITGETPACRWAAREGRPGVRRRAGPLAGFRQRTSPLARRAVIAGSRPDAGWRLEQSPEAGHGQKAYHHDGKEAQDASQPASERAPATFRKFSPVQFGGSLVLILIALNVHVSLRRTSPVCRSMLDCRDEARA